MNETRRLPWEVRGRAWLDGVQRWADQRRWTRFAFALLMFGIKQAYACLFGGAMLGLILGTFVLWPDDSPVSRYDFLVVGAVAIQAAEGVAAVGIDPTVALIDHARRMNPGGDYRAEAAEALGFEDGAFDLVVSYLSLIDIPDVATAIAEMARVLAPGGRLLIANLAGYNSAADANDLGWVSLPDGRRVHAMDHYLEEKVGWIAWRGIRIQNWHRPLSTYMTLLLGQGLTLTHFAEPRAHGGDPLRQAHYDRAPWFMMMEWEKPS